MLDQQLSDYGEGYVSPSVDGSQGHGERQIVYHACYERTDELRAIILVKFLQILASSYLRN